MDASNMLKPMLARGELHAIGATTLDEYRKHIEKDAALSAGSSRSSSGSRASRTPSRSCAACASGTRRTTRCGSSTRRWWRRRCLSHRYIADRFLPDKAIDLVDEAASKLRMEITSMPVELDEAERRIMQLEIEREALKKEKDAASQDRLRTIEKELADLQGGSRDALRSRWESERQAIQSVSECGRRSTDQGRDRAGAAGLRPEPGRRTAVRHAARAGGEAARCGAPGRPTRRATTPEGGGRRRGHRRDRQPLDRGCRSAA
jgi:ATP-dependent Clp protease ATP-binding subunit ClpB